MFDAHVRMSISSHVKMAMVQNHPNTVRLYRESPEFHAAVALIADAFPVMLEAIVEEAQNAETVRSRMMSLANYGLLPNLDHLEP